MEWKERCVGLPRNQLTNSELVVNHTSKGAQNDPYISTLGMKTSLNIVNMLEQAPIFPL
jgi:hypothetical protein